MKINKIYMTSTGRYNDQMSRPFETSLDQAACQQFGSLTADKTTVSANALAGLAGSIMRPSAIPQGMIAIANGWDTYRIRFMMEVEMMSAFNTTVREVLSGYTDHLGIMNGFIDPNMKMYFNASSTVKTTQIAAPTGTTFQAAVNDASQILTSDRSAVVNAPYLGIPEATSMRPEDVVGRMTSNALLAVDPGVVDTRQSFAGGPKYSRRSNGQSSEYISRVMNAMSLAARDPKLQYATQFDIIDRARDDLREVQITQQDRFIGKLMMETNFRHDGYITYGELCRMFPEADSVNVVATRGETYATSVPVMATPDRGSTEYWNVTTNEAQHATSLSHAVPGIMMDLMLMGVTFQASNRTHNSEFEIVVTGYNSFVQNMNMVQYIELFKHRLKTEILADISRQGLIDLAVRMKVDLAGDTEIEICFAGGAPTTFVTPSFCDALMSPVLAHNAQAVHGLSADMETLYNNMGVKYQVQAQMPHFQTQPAAVATPASPGVNHEQVNRLI